MTYISHFSTAMKLPVQVNHKKCWHCSATVQQTITLITLKCTTAAKN